MVATPASAATVTSTDGSLTITANDQVAQWGCANYSINYSLTVPDPPVAAYGDPTNEYAWVLAVYVSGTGGAGSDQVLTGLTGSASGTEIPNMCLDRSGPGPYLVTAYLYWYDSRYNFHTSEVDTTLTLTGTPKPPPPVPVPVSHATVASHLTMITPAVVRKGHTMMFTGMGTYKPRGAWIPLNGELEFDYTPSIKVAKPVWKNIGRIGTSMFSQRVPKGSYWFPYKPTATGYYRVLYSGTTLTKPSSGISYIKVVA